MTTTIEANEDLVAAAAQLRAAQATLTQEQDRLAAARAALAEVIAKTQAADPDGREIETLAASRAKLEAKITAHESRTEKFKTDLAGAEAVAQAAELVAVNARLEEIKAQVTAGGSEIMAAARTFLEGHRARVAALNFLREEGVVLVDRRQALRGEPTDPLRFVRPPVFGSLWSIQEPRLANRPMLDLLARLIEQDDLETHQRDQEARRRAENGLIGRVVQGVTGIFG